jgi:hypothetical protein
MAERVNLLVPAEVVPRLSLPGGHEPAPVGGGHVYLRDVPAAVAEQWIAQNPGVRAVVRRPAVRRFRPRVYTIASVLCLIAAVQVVIVLAVDGTDNPLWLWLAAPIALGGGGIALAYKSIPFEHVRFDG